MNVIDAVKAVLAKHGAEVPLARIGPLLSKTAGEYIGFTCRSCHAVYGDWFMRSERMEVLVGRPYGAPEDGCAETYWQALLPAGPETSIGWHWCASGDATAGVRRPDPGPRRQRVDAPKRERLAASTPKGVSGTAPSDAAAASNRSRMTPLSGPEAEERAARLKRMYGVS